MRKNKTNIHNITRGYDILLKGEAAKRISDYECLNYFISPDDFRWMTPQLLVEEGDTVQVGTPLFADSNNAKIVVVAPVGGEIKGIVRGEKRRIESIVIAGNGQKEAEIALPENFDKENVKDLLLRSGLWTCIRQRPFSVIANPDDTPKAIFVSCFDTTPLAPDLNFILKDKKEEFHKGTELLKLLAPVTLCMRQNADNSIFEEIEGVEKHYFSGPHPAGNVGTQIHKINPINKGEIVWFVNPQDVVTIGKLALYGKLSFEKTIALTGPCVKEPQYYKMTYGADISGLISNSLDTTPTVRVISGNVLTGKHLADQPSVRFYDSQITVIAEGGEREFIGWLLPGLKKWSFSHTFLAFLTKKHKYNFDTTLHGEARNFVMTDIYEKVFPFDIIPLELLKACLIKDVEKMEDLGIYEVDDEDFALCEVVCPAKTECQKIIREGLFTVKNS